MHRLGLVLLGLTTSLPAWATTYGTADYGGGSIILANGDRITGTLSNVGWFYVPSGVTVTTVAGAPVEVYADFADIYGTIDLTGRGEAGGLGVVGTNGADGSGLGAGTGGFYGPCVHGGGGGGGAHGGNGGTGGYLFTGSVAFGGLAYGNSNVPVFPLDLGSGGGAGGSSCSDIGSPGGAGGGALLIQANDLWFSSGTLFDASGGIGSDGLGSGGGGGGGAGGTVVLVASNYSGTATVRVQGGDGGSVDNTQLNSGGGGGGGGRIKIIYAGSFPSILAYTSGGLAGDMNAGNDVQATGGSFGSIRYVFQDLDGDDVTDALDNCPDTANGSQFDSDNDGLGDNCDPCPFLANEQDADNDGWYSCDDCDETNPNVNPGEFEDIASGIDEDCDGQELCWIDNDQDGFGSFAVGYTANLACSGASYSTNSDDCDDNNSSVYPGQLEYCDGIDNNCDTLFDDASSVDQSLWYRDLDGDSFGDPADVVLTCYGNGSQVLNDQDCDDTDPNVNPNATEFCNTIDDDCSGVADDNAIDADLYYADSDLDGFGDPNTPVYDCWGGPDLSSDNTDCDDTAADIRPDATEVCDGLDNDCDDQIDDADDSLDLSSAETFYEDLDGDGFGSDNAIQSCLQPEETATNSDDCDDSEASIYPGAEEIVDDTVDSDCDGDSDNDGVSDADEADAGMDPYSNDSDGDGVPDGIDPAPTDAGGKPEQQDKPIEPQYGLGCTTAPAPTGMVWLLMAGLGLARRRRP